MLLSALISFSNLSFAQGKIKFSNESEIFITEVQTVLQNTVNKAVKDKAETYLPALTERWNSGRFNKVEKDNIKEISQKMVDDNLANDMVFGDFFNVVNDLAYSQLDHESLSNYLIYTNNLYKTSGNKALKEHLIFSANFLEKGVLSTASNMKWYLRNARCKIPSSKELVLKVENGTIVCASTRDSIVIEKTSGVFSKNDLTWNGKGGKTTWHRFNLDEEKVFAQFSKYSINMKTIEYSADSVTFYNKEAFAYPLLGSLKDKTFANKPNNAKFPVFASYRDDYDLKNVFPDIDLNGFVGMQGAEFSVFGNKYFKASMTVGRADSTLAMFQAKSFIIKDSKIKADAVSLNFMLDGDSLSHNGLALQFDNTSREFVFYNDNKTMASGPFYDTYHQVNIFAEALYWNVDGNQLKFNKLMSPNQDSKAYFKSMYYFKNVEWDRLQGIDDYNPLILIGRYMEKYQTDVIDVSFLASYLNRNVEQVVSMILRLVEQGYVSYDADSKTAYPKESLYYAINAKNGDIDYDVIRIESFTTKRQPNMVLDLTSRDLTVYGVEKVIVSEAKNVNIVPYKNTIVVKRGLNIDFSGVMMAGLFEFYTQTSHFKYSDFAIELPAVDSISFYVKRRADDKDANSSDYVKVRNVITNVSGVIYIDKFFNKSGLEDNPEYPIFDCVKDSHVNYGDMTFVLPPFKIDSLLTFSTSEFNLKGVFNSGIFPDFEEELLVMDDYSLGFNHQLEEGGMKLLGGNATFNNIIHLSNDGFYGNGTLNFMTSFIETQHIDFYKDSLVCKNGKFEMLAVDDKDLSYPYATVGNTSAVMKTVDNKLLVKTLKEPIEMYDNSTFNGVACLDAMGFTGKGVLNIDVAKVKSNYFTFENSVFEADSSRFAIVADGGADAFLATNYWSSVDFDKRIGSFKFLDENSKLTFPFNKFECTLDKAEWKIDERTISLSSDYDGEFISSNPNQNKLTFASSKADYDMNFNTIIAQEVDTLLVADAMIVLSDGIITIGKDADIEPINNATIIADTTEKLHRFYNAEVKILGKNDYHASGNLDFKDHDGRVTQLTFNDIYVDSTGMTKASGKVSEFDNFLVSRDYLYQGDIYLESKRKNLEFDGHFLMINPCLTDYQWFKSKSVIDPDSIVLPLNDTVFEYNSGLYYDSLNKEFFVAFLSDNLIYEPSMTVASFKDELVFDSVNQSIKNGNLILELENCIIKGENELNFGFDDSFVKLASEGEFTYDINMDELRFVMKSSLKFLFEDKLIDRLANEFVKTANDTVKNVKMKDEHEFVFEDLKMKWVGSLHCLVNEAPIKIKSMKNHYLNNTFNGHLLLNYNDTLSLTLYLEYAGNQWVYFNYKEGVLTSVSTDNDYNEQLANIKEKQRHFINKRTNQEYEFVIGDFTEVNNFMLMMNYLQGK